MPTRINEVVQHLYTAVLRQGEVGLTDGQLLGRFIAQRDEAAVAALLRRHGPMVWGVCRRVLSNHHDAEDAFQATFLVLVRKAASIAPREMVGNWLYGVAHQTALKTNALLAKRRSRESQVAEMPEPEAAQQDPRHDLQPVLDRELHRLPDKYRVAIVLCDLQGKTRKEAARQLGLPEGTLAGRLTRGRALLAKRLARGGALLSAGSLAAVLSESAALACVPASVMSATIKAAHLLAAGQATGVISARVAAVTEGVLKAMLMTRLRTTLGICLVLGFLMLGTVFGYRTLAADKPATAPPPPNDSLSDTLILLDKQWWEAASSYDVDTLGKILADDWIGFNATGPLRWTKAIGLNNYRQGRFLEVKFLTEREVFRIDEHTAMMSYEVKWRCEDKGKGPREGWGHARLMHCWVQRDGGWHVKYTECVNLPVEGPGAPPIFQLELAPPPGTKLGARASGSWETNTPDHAFDGNRETCWNSGGYAPAWIEADLGASTPLASILLIPCQDIIGPTTHEVWVSSEPIGDDRSKAKLLHTFQGETHNGGQLTIDFPKDLSARYVQVRSTQSPTWIAWWEIEIRVPKDGQPHGIPLNPPAEQKNKPAGKPRVDKEALKGTWRVIAVEFDGKEATQPWADRQRKEEWVVKDGWIAVQSTDLEHVPLSEVFAVRSDKSPKEIDINPYPIGPFLESDIVKGIYTLEGDVWKVCLPCSPLTVPSKESTERPKEVATKEGGSTVVLTLKRKN